MANQQEFDKSMAEQQEILADRQRGWEGFTQFLTWSVVVTVVLLLALLLFVV